MKILDDDINLDILLMADNNLGLLGGERESTRIIIQAAQKKYKIAELQPGEYKEEDLGIRFYHLTKKRRLKQLIHNPVMFLKYCLDVSKFVKSVKPQLIHTQSQASFFIVSFLKRIRFISRKVLLVHTERGLYTKYDNFIRRFFMFSFKYVDVLVTTTNFNKTEWNNALKKKRMHVNIRVIENTAGEIYERIDRKRLITNDFITIGFAGRYCDWKGWDLAEKICIQASEEVKDCHVKMCISCFEKNDCKEVASLFQRLTNIYGNRFSGIINVPFEDMEQFYYDIDVYILTSWPLSESFGRTLVEAMSRECAILSTDAGGAVEVMGSLQNICYDAGDFVNHLKDWNNHNDKLTKEKKANFLRVHKNYSIENNQSKYLSLYAELLQIRQEIE